MASMKSRVVGLAQQGHDYLTIANTLNVPVAEVARAMKGEEISGGEGAPPAPVSLYRYTPTASASQQMLVVPFADHVYIGVLASGEAKYDGIQITGHDPPADGTRLHLQCDAVRTAGTPTGYSAPIILIDRSAASVAPAPNRISLEGGTPFKLFEKAIGEQFVYDAVRGFWVQALNFNLH